MRIGHLRHNILQSINDSPLIYFSLVRLRKHRNFIVTKNTDITIEGYPRSANTFSVYAYMYAQKVAGKEDLNIAHHLHAPAQIKKAVKLKLPTVVLIRKPEDAVLSVAVKRPGVSISHALNDYIRFYSRIYKYHGSFFVAKFEDVTNDFGRVMKNINKFFGTSFAEFEHTERNVGICFNIMKQREKYLYDGDDSKFAFPTKSKEHRKVALRKKMSHPKNVDTLSRANELYALFNQL